MPENLVVLRDARFRAVFETGDKTTFEFAFPGIAGVVHHYHAHSVPERDENGQTLSVLNVGRDITAVKHASACRT